MARVDTRRDSALAGAFRHISSVSPPKRQLRRWSSYFTAVQAPDGRSRFKVQKFKVKQERGEAPAWLVKVLLAPSRPRAMTVLL
jgi:hypothetical protein